MGIKEYGNMQSNLSNQNIDAISEWLLTQMARFKLQKRAICVSNHSEIASMF